jgi:DNA-binding NtrC family response regulator
VSEGRLREDLYYRLRVFPIRLPPLRERKEDIPILASHFIGIINKKTGKQIKGISIQAMRLLMDYTWPGNVRELENSIEHAFVLCNREQIDVQDLPFEILNNDRSACPATTAQVQIPVRRLKPTRETLMNLLNECRWNKAEVGRRIGLSRTAVWKYMKKWDIPLKDSLQEEILK